MVLPRLSRREPAASRACSSFSLPDEKSTAFAIVLLCARTELTPEQQKTLQNLLARDPDWNWLLDLALHHRVYPLVFSNMMKYAPAAMPAPVRTAFGDAFEENRRRMMVLTAELLRLSTALEDAGIPSVPLKGPALAWSAYQNLALRPAGDLDILIEPEKVFAALEVLRAAGYSVILREAGAVAKADQEAAVRKYLYHFILVNEQTDAVVELHFNLSPAKMPYKITPAAIIERAETCRIGGADIRVMNTEDNFLFLCLHGGKHAWSRLEWLTGVAEFLRGHPVDERSVSKLAAERGMLRPLLLGAALIERLIDPRLVPYLSTKANSAGTIRKLCDRVEQRLSDLDTEPNAPAAFQLALCSSVSGRLRWIFCNSVQPGHADIRAAEAKHPGYYYFLRPVRLVRKWIAD